MNQSLFSSYFDSLVALLKGVVLKVTTAEKREEEDPVYLLETLMDEKYSVDGTYSEIQGMNRYVMADYVAMDSTMNIKTRPTLGKVSGEIPKMGISFTMSEKQLKDVMIMRATGTPANIMVERIFNDTVRCIRGIRERMEYALLLGFSAGVTEMVDGTNNDGTSIRINYGYQNKYGVSKLWTDPTATPIADLQRVRRLAIQNGKRPNIAYMDQTAFDRISNSAEIKGYLQANLVTGTPFISDEAVRRFFMSELGLEIYIVDRTVNFEADNGTITTLNAWDAGKVILTQKGKIGTVVYTDLAEEKFPTAGVDSAKSGSHILVMKYSTNNPKREYTVAESMAVPVVTAIDAIYQIDTLELQS